MIRIGYCVHTVMLIAVTSEIIISAVVAEQNSAAEPVDSQASAIDLCRLLYRPEVRAKLGVSDDSFKKLQGSLDRLRESVPTYLQFQDANVNLRLNAESPVWLKASEIDGEVWELITEILPPAQLKMLIGAHINEFGYRALLNKRVETYLGITEGQHQQMCEVVQAERTARRSVLVDVASGRASDSSKEKLFLREDVFLEKISEVLGPNQRSQLVELKKSGGSIAPFQSRFTFGW